MVFDVAFLVTYLSRFMSLQPGDIIATGTPPESALDKNLRFTYGPATQSRLESTASGSRDSRSSRTGNHLAGKPGTASAFL